MGFVVSSRMKTCAVSAKCGHRSSRSHVSLKQQRAVVRKATSTSTPTTTKSLKKTRGSIRVQAVAEEPQITQVNTPLNGDPFVGMMETPVTSSPIVANYLSNLPAYRIAVSPLLRGVEIGLAHGFFIVGPFIKVYLCIYTYWTLNAALMSIIRTY